MRREDQDYLQDQITRRLFDRVSASKPQSRHKSRIDRKDNRGSPFSRRVA